MTVPIELVAALVLFVFVLIAVDLFINEPGNR